MHIERRAERYAVPADHQMPWVRFFEPQGVDRRCRRGPIHVVTQRRIGDDLSSRQVTQEVSVALIDLLLIGHPGQVRPVVRVERRGNEDEGQRQQQREPQADEVLVYLLAGYRPDHDGCPLSVRVSRAAAAGSASMPPRM